MRAAIATAMLITMFTGGAANAVFLWRDFAVVSKQVEQLEENDRDKGDDIKEIRRMVREIYWHFIKKQGDK